MPETGTRISPEQISSSFPSPPPTHTPSPHCTPRNHVKYSALPSHALQTNQEHQLHSVGFSKHSRQYTGPLPGTHGTHQALTEAVKTTCLSPPSELQPHRPTHAILPSLGLLKHQLSPRAFAHALFPSQDVVRHTLSAQSSILQGNLP